MRRVFEFFSASFILCAMLFNSAYSSKFNLFSLEFVYALLVLICLGISSQLIFDKFKFGPVILISVLLFLFIDQVGDYSFWYKPLPWLILTSIVGFIFRANLKYFCGVIFLVMILVTLILSIYEAIDEEIFKLKYYVENLEPKGKSSTLPPLVHIVFDEHIGIDGLPRNFNKTVQVRRRLTKFYEENSFHIYGRAFSRYFDTRASLATAFNFENNGSPERYLSKDTLLRNKYLEMMDHIGYSINVYQTQYLQYCHDNQKFSGRCTTYNSYDYGVLEELEIPRATKSMLILRKLSDEIVIVTSVINKLLKWVYSTIPNWRSFMIRHEPPSGVLYGPVNSLKLMDAFLEDMQAIKQGDLFLVHLILPHYTYLLDEKCEPRSESYLNRNSVLIGTASNDHETRRYRYKLYSEQLLCATLQVERVLTVLAQKHLLKEALIIIHGDHGSRIQVLAPNLNNKANLTNNDYLDGFSTLFVVKAPEFAKGYSSDGGPLDRLLRETIEDVFDVDIPHRDSEDSVYLSTEPIEQGTMTGRW